MGDGTECLGLVGKRHGVEQQGFLGVTISCHVWFQRLGDCLKYTLDRI